MHLAGRKNKEKTGCIQFKFMVNSDENNTMEIEHRNENVVKNNKKIHNSLPSKNEEEHTQNSNPLLPPTQIINKLQQS